MPPTEPSSPLATRAETRRAGLQSFSAGDAAPLAHSGRYPTRRAAAARRRRMRLRRSATLTVVALAVGTFSARLLEDPNDITADLAARSVSASGPTRSDGPDGQAVAARIVTPGTPAPTATATAKATSGTSPRATPHVDEDADGSVTPAPNSSLVTVPQSGTGHITPQTIPAGQVKTTGRTVRYSVEVEDGLPVNGEDVAAEVHTVLTDPRGWQTKDNVRFVPVEPAQLAAGAGVDVRVTLASPSLTAKLCAPLNVTAQQVSCWNGSRSVLNLTRWMLGAQTYGSDLASYRIYLISHEVGHGLGHQHDHCPVPGRPASVMVQQTKSLEGCTASPWPTGT